MKQFLLAIGITILTSLYFFPFNPVWLPAINTKMALAGLAIPLYIMRGARLRNSDVNSGMLGLTMCGLSVSLAGLIAVVVNNTGDYSYASYFVSMWVWLGGAYTVILAMEAVYGKVTLRMVGNFLIAVCVAQCILAQVISASDAVAAIVNRLVVSSGFMGIVEDRLYGIGCALDVAGLRFSAVLLILTFFCLTPNSKQNRQVERCLYIMAFFVIGVFGSMIARTTSVGVILSIVMWILYSCFNRDEESRSNSRKMFKVFMTSLIILVPFIMVFYNQNADFRENLRFGFEGFFSLAEEGEWDVRSNRQLMSMVIWPDNLKTWMIGDGYFSQPQNDYYYVGPMYDYYMGTDFGYSRFIFYFGILGLISFASVFVASTIVCSRSHRKYTLMFAMIMLMNFIGWIKASTDIFLVFAILLCVCVRYNGADEKQYEDSIPDSLDV